MVHGYNRLIYFYFIYILVKASKTCPQTGQYKEHIINPCFKHIQEPKAILQNISTDIVRTYNRQKIQNT